MLEREEHYLFVEKYRPQTLDDYIGNEGMINKCKTWIKEGEIPHLLLGGTAGTGKTTMAKILANSIDCDLLYMNASDENSVDAIRNKVKGFASSIGFKDLKVIILDECLTGDTLVTILSGGNEIKKPISQLDEKNELVKTFNIKTNKIEWSPFYLFSKEEKEIWELELENGELIKCSEEHKWFVEDNKGKIIVVKTNELEKYSHILSPI